MIEELINKPSLILCIDYGVNINDYSGAVISLNYNNKNYVIYETNDKEQVKALDEISKIERLKDEALERIEEIENAKPSEALERFEYIGNDIKFAFDDDYISYDYTEDVVYVKQALIKSQVQEKALSIIKEKCVDVGYVIMLFMYKDYNSKMDELWGNKAPSYYLTEQEFKLLKEVFCNE